VRADERKEEAKIFYKNFIYKGKERSVRLMRECQQGTILLVQIYSPWLKCVEGWRGKYLSSNFKYTWCNSFTKLQDFSIISRNINISFTIYH